jgi:hypothetical protein
LHAVRFGHNLDHAGCGASALDNALNDAQDRMMALVLPRDAITPGQPASDPIASDATIYALFEIFAVRR